MCFFNGCFEEDTSNGLVAMLRYVLAIRVGLSAILRKSLQKAPRGWLPKLVVLEIVSIFVVGILHLNNKKAQFLWGDSTREAW